MSKITRNKLLNMLTESFLFKRFKLLMLNQFKWEGQVLKDFGIEERHIESYLFDNGYCLFFKDSETGFKCLPCSGIGQPNVYNDYVRFRATGFNYSKEVALKDAVLIENNKLRIPTDEAVLYFVTRLYDLVRTMDVNVKQLRLQSLFTATDKTRLTVKKIIDEVDENNWAIITDSTMNLPDEIVHAVQTGVKPLTSELTDRYNAVLNEALTYFGINNANTDKRERLISDEVNSNNQFIDSCAEMFLEARQRACDEINEKFGTDLKVTLRNPAGGGKNVDKPISKDISE